MNNIEVDRVHFVGGVCKSTNAQNAKIGQITVVPPSVSITQYFVCVSQDAMCIYTTGFE